MAPTLWLRHEVKKDEHRSGLSPAAAKELISNGFKIYVERSPDRFFEDKEFTEVGCELVETGTWRDAPRDYFIVGLKELPEGDTSPLVHRHIFFGHCFKYQHGWKELLGRFVAGGGTLLDMEFLNDEQGRRVAAFGYYAGFAGAAVGIDVWAHQQMAALKMEPAAYPPIEPFANEEALIAHIRGRIASTQAKTGAPTFPRVHVIGALGRCGSGAVDMTRRAGIPEENIIRWDMAETAKGGPFLELLESDIFINCIYLSKPIPPFLTTAELAKGGKLRVLVDVSCDATNPHNPLPFYSACTTFKSPILTIPKNDPSNDYLDVIAIDHLPTLLPRESSERFSQDLLPTYLQLKDIDNARVWQDAKKLFDAKVKEAQA